MFFEEDKVKNIIADYQSLVQKINEVLKFYSDLDEVVYYFLDAFVEKDTLFANVEFYNEEYEDWDTKVIQIEFKILESENNFENFKKEMKIKIEKNILLKEKAKLEKKRKAKFK